MSAYLSHLSDERLDELESEGTERLHKFATAYRELRAENARLVSLLRASGIEPERIVAALFGETP
jgi:hypothetical protein